MMSGGEHTFVATPVQLDQNAAGTFATTYVATPTPPNMLSSGGGNGLHRAAVTSNSTSSSYTFLQIKREPCQVSEVTTSNHQQHQQLTAATHQPHQPHQQQHASSTSISATGSGKTISTPTLTTLVKIEPPSPKVPDLIEKGTSGNTSNSVPIGIAVARKRQQESSSNLASSAPIPFGKDLNCFGIRVADLGSTGCGNIFFTGNGDLMTGSAAATAEELALQSVNRAPSTIWQYPSAALPFESVISMSPATVGLQYSREASRAGQVVLLPAATAAALGISNIPPLCYTPTDPFQQAAAAAAALVWPTAYLPQSTATAPPTAATLQSPHNFIFPTMNSAHTAAAAAAATLQPQSYAAAASLQLFGSSYLRNATEFMAAAGKNSTNTPQNNLIAATATNAATAALTMPATPVGAGTALAFETRDKTTMTTTSTSNLLDLQSSTQAALNLIRLPTPPISATMGESTNAASQLHATSQILFQAASPAPALLNLSTTGPNAEAGTLSRNHPSATPNCNTNITTSNGFLNNITAVGPPTPVCDEPSTTTATLALNFKASTRATDAVNTSSIVVGGSRNLVTVQPSTSTAVVPPQPQMQDVNIQTDTPVCSEDENSTCPLATMQQQVTLNLPLTTVPVDASLTSPTYNCILNNEKMYNGSEEITEPLELTKTRNNVNDCTARSQIDDVQTQIIKEKAMCHNERDEMKKGNVDAYDDCVGKRTVRNSECETYMGTNDRIHMHESENEEQQPRCVSPESTVLSTGNDVLNKDSSTAVDFAGLELLSNISASSLPNKPVSDALGRGQMMTNTSNIANNFTMLRVKQEPLDSIVEQPPPQPQQDTFLLPTVATKMEHNGSIAARNAAYERPIESPQRSNILLELPPKQPQVVETPAATEPLGGLNLLCALAEQRIHEEEEEQGGTFFASSPTNQLTSSTSFGTFQQQPSTSFLSMESIELPTASGVDLTTAVSSPAAPTTHVKRKKHKHSKSAKSLKSSSASGSSIGAFANGVVSPSLLSGRKSSKHSSKKNKKKYSKEKKRQHRSELAAAAGEIDLNDEKLQEELQKAFISGTNNVSCIQSGGPSVKWPSAQEIFNIMESRMRQRLAEITRQYQKKKRKLDEISKTQRKKKKCSKLIAQQLQQQIQLQQQNLLSSPLTTSTLSLNGNSTSSIGDYKFLSKFSSSASSGPSSTTTHSSYLQPSSFPLRFPPLSASTADEDSDKNSHSRTNKKNPIYKPVRLEPSSLSAAVVANGSTNGNNSNAISNCNNNSNNNTNNNNNNNASTNSNDQNNYNLSTAMRLAQKHSSTEPPALPLNNKEPKLMKKEKTDRHTLLEEKRSFSKIKKAKLTKIVPASSSPNTLASQQHPRSETDQELTLTNEHLYRNETRVLTDMGGLFYAGVMKPLQPPDVYAITLDGERGNKPHIMSREEIFKDTILEVAPKDVDSVPVGTRLCAYWSQQYRCLYPGRAIESESSEGDEQSTQKDFVSVEFDDGDSGRIRLQNIRLLLSDYPIVEYNDNPLYSLGKQKKTGIKNKNQIATSSAGLDGNTTAAQLFEKKLGQPSTLPLTIRSGDTEMYARRTEKRRIKKNTKMKSQKGKKQLGVVANNSNESITNLTSVATESLAEHNRKHHKHKKHKKHKKHHRKVDDASDKSFVVHNKTDGNEITVDQTERLEVQGVEQNNQHHQQISNRSNLVVKPIKLESNKASGSVRVKTEQLEIEEESASNMMSENSDEVKGDEDEKIEHNNSKGSKIAAFLPERQLWGWLGTAYRKAGVKGRARKQFYKTIKRGKELITVGDCAVFLSTGRPDRPYIGRIESMWETSSSNKVVRVRWFYHPEETTDCPNLKYPGALFESPHEDENDVQTISHRCEVLPFERYFEKFGADTKQYQSIYDNNDTYYLAGYYNPRMKALTFQENIPTTTANASISIDSNPTSRIKVNKGGEKKQTNTSTGTSIP